MKKQLPILFAIVITMLFGVNTNAQELSDTLSTSYGDGADGYVTNDDKGAADLVSGGSTFTIRNHEVRKRIAYLKFDIADNSRFDLIEEAFIGLYVKYAEKMADTAVEVTVYGMIDEDKDDWVDTLLSYSNAPGMVLANLNSYKIDDNMLKPLTTISIKANTVGRVYSKPSVEMDEFINADKNNLLTFVLIVEKENTGDEVRVYTEEFTDFSWSPILHGVKKPVNVENISMSSFNLKQNSPNPFNGITTLTYNLNQPNHVELTMYNMLGTKVATLVNEYGKTGEYNVNVDMNKLQLSSGVYYAKLTVNGQSSTIKMINRK